ncbi:MAG TPA: IclR family transcriptional regulator [Epulopiscium sp.]|nr:IclR family transcriptional regulator [Candidatus Epulonipiscium sp.]
MAKNVQSVNRTLVILETLSMNPKGLGVGEISERTELHKSTAHRLLATLVDKGYVKQNQYNNYQLTLKLFELGSKLVEELDMLEVARPYLSQIMEEINEVVHLVVLEDNAIVYVDKVEPNKTIRMHSRIGIRRPLYCTAVGKAILSTMEDEEVEEIWAKSKIKELTEYTITDLDKMKKELEGIRKKGYSTDEQENELGVRCIAIPLLDYTKKAWGAISISGPVERMTDETFEQIIKVLIPIGSEIRNELGYHES